MSKLDCLAVESYRRLGFYFPIEVLSPAELSQYTEHFILSQEDDRVRRPSPHLGISWLSDLVRHSKILDSVESLVGPDIFCLGSRFFNKPPNSGAFVSWHQDAEYLGLSFPEVVTAWIAFTPSTRASGCVRFIPGSHAQRVAHAEAPSDGNMLSLGQELTVAVNEDHAVCVELEPGQMSLHHPLIIHGSEPNRSDAPRIGFGIQYIPTRISSRQAPEEGLLLVRGKDRFGHFKHFQS